MSDLLSWAEFEFELNKTDENGITQREHLQQVERQTGYTPKALENPTPFPKLLMYIWSAYVRLSRRRGSGFSGPEALSPTMVKDWINITREPLSGWDVELIFKLDEKFMEVFCGR
jgi:hypothetical protein